ncbi:MAG TPA: thioredoxin domain-containing protein [Gemmatimonadales bacterium]|jgi:protein-disulfide isomerase|nr:thioredoxin domain-containing protein [Gemmatimonadales bacterium]
MASKRTELFLNVITIAAVASAVTVAGLMVRQQLAGGPSVAQRTARREPTRQIPDWSQYAVGHRVGPDSARVVITEWADFECPFCARFEGALHSILRKYPNDVSVVFRHFPLPMHRFAYPSARATECAGNQGKFANMHDALYGKQDSLGLISFDEFAARSGVQDMKAFRACLSTSAPVAVVEADVKAGKAIGVRATPTFLVNDQLVTGIVDSLTLDSLVRRALSTRSNVSAPLP